MNPENSVNIFQIVYSNNIEALKKLISSGFDINAPNAFGHTPLFLSSYHGRQEFLRELILADVDIHKVVNGETALHRAAYNGQTPCLLELTTAGAHIDINIPNQYGNTPLHIAAGCGQITFIRELLKFGANPFLFNLKNQTPKDMAHASDHPDCVEVMASFELMQKEKAILTSSSFFSQEHKARKSLKL